MTLEEGDESGENLDGSEKTLSSDDRGGEADENASEAGM